MNMKKIEKVQSENIGEGYMLIDKAGNVSPMVEYVDWVQQSDDENDIIVEVTFSDDSTKTFAKGEELQQIWHEDVE